MSPLYPKAFVESLQTDLIFPLDQHLKHNGSRRVFYTTYVETIFWCPINLCKQQNLSWSLWYVNDNFTFTWCTALRRTSCILLSVFNCWVTLNLSDIQQAKCRLMNCEDKWEVIIMQVSTTNETAKRFAKLAITALLVSLSATRRLSPPATLNPEATCWHTWVIYAWNDNVSWQWNYNRLLSFRHNAAEQEINAAAAARSTFPHSLRLAWWEVREVPSLALFSPGGATDSRI
jgi:hypothetical protein